MAPLVLKTVLNPTLLVHELWELLSKYTKSTISFNLRINSVLQTHLFVFWFYTNQGTPNSWQTRVLWRHLLDKIYCATSKHPGKIWIVSTFIRIKPENKVENSYYLNIFLWVEHFFKMNIGMIFMILHSSSPDSSTKSPTLTGANLTDSNPTTDYDVVFKLIPWLWRIGSESDWPLSAPVEPILYWPRRQ